MDLVHYLFFAFAGVLILSSVFVVTARNPVHGILFLVLSFFSAACLWMLVNAEFLALVLILVYVGAVMTLFLFVVMMMNINKASTEQGFVKYLPFAGVVVAVIVGIMVALLGPHHFSAATIAQPVQRAVGYSNVTEIGNVLYTRYLYPFELAGVLLLVAIVAAISLAYRGRRRSKGEIVGDQVQVKAADRLRIVKMPSEKKGK